MHVEIPEDKRIRIATADDLYTIMHDILKREENLGSRPREHFWVAGLGDDYKLSYIELVSLGTKRFTIAEPREVFSIAVEKRVKYVFLVHNHVTDNLQPSEADLDITDRLIQTGRILDIVVFDHIILNESGHISFLYEGYMARLHKSLKYVPPYQVEDRIKEIGAMERKEGKKEGEREKAIETARNMLGDGMSVESVAKYTGLSVEVIEGL